MFLIHIIILGAVKGPHTPKSCSPKSQDSISQSHELEFHDDSREMTSLRSDSAGPNSCQPLGPRSPSPTPLDNAGRPKRSICTTD